MDQRACVKYLASLVYLVRRSWGRPSISGEDTHLNGAPGRREELVDEASTDEVPGARKRLRFPGQMLARYLANPKPGKEGRAQYT